MVALESNTLKWVLLPALGQTFSLHRPHLSMGHSEPVFEQSYLLRELTCLEEWLACSRFSTNATGGVNSQEERIAKHPAHYVALAWRTVGAQ